MSWLDEAKKDAEDVVKGQGTVYHLERLAQHVLAFLHLHEQAPEPAPAVEPAPAPAAPAGVVEGAEIPAEPKVS